MQNQVFGQDISSLSSRNLDQTFQHIVCTRNDSDPFFSASCLKDDDRIDFLISKERERLSLPDDSRRTQRYDLVIKILLQEFLFFRLSCCEIDQCNAIFCNFIHQILICGIFPLIEFFYNF